MIFIGKLNDAEFSPDLAISFCGVLPSTEVAFGFAGENRIGDFFGIRGERAELGFSVSLPMPEFARTLSISIGAVISRCTYRIRRICERFCCTVSAICRRVTVKCRRLYRNWESPLPLTFEHVSRVVLGWRL